MKENNEKKEKKLGAQNRTAKRGKDEVKERMRREKDRKRQLKNYRKEIVFCRAVQGCASCKAILCHTISS